MGKEADNIWGCACSGEGAGLKEGDAEVDVDLGQRAYGKMYRHSIEFLEAALFLTICGRILGIVGLLGTISLTSYFNSN